MIVFGGTLMNFLQVRCGHSGWFITYILKEWTTDFSFVFFPLRTEGLFEKLVSFICFMNVATVQQYILSAACGGEEGKPIMCVAWDRHVHRTKPRNHLFLTCRSSGSEPVGPVGGASVLGRVLTWAPAATWPSRYCTTTSVSILSSMWLASGCRYSQRLALDCVLEPPPSIM